MGVGVNRIGKVYSLRLKRMRWVDIATLAALYTLRVVAGAAAAQVFVSGFMLIFVFPVFISLGCVKRLTELTLANSGERLPGRGYGRSDRGDLLNVAGLGTAGALLIFFLYTLSDQAGALYPIQWILWVAMIRAYPVVTHTHYMYGVASSGPGGDKAGMDVSQREDLSFPRSLPEFQRLFPDGTACAA